MSSTNISSTLTSLQSTSKIYLDHNATTPLGEAARQALLNHIDEFGNPSSIHWAGRIPKMVLREARNAVAKSLNVQPLEIVFTGSASESNNLILKGVVDQLRAQGKASNTVPKILTSTVEHPSVLYTLEQIKGIEVLKVPVDRSGTLDMNFYSKALESKAVHLVSIMTANNETGSVFPIGKLGKMAHEGGALFHTDAVQALGKMELDLPRWNIDFASFSAHKFYCLKGVGVAYIKRGLELPSLIHGGGQERSRRAGTENVLGIATLGAMCGSLSAELVNEKSKYMQELRNHMESRIEKEIQGIDFHCRTQPRTPNTSHFSVQGINGESLLMALDLKGFAVSTGAACSGGSTEPSPVLLAMGFSKEEAQSSLRVSLGWRTTLEEIDRYVTVLGSTIRHLREVNL